MIDVVVGRLADQGSEAVLRPVDAFLSPVSHASRELEREAGEEIQSRLRDTGELPVGGAILTPAGPLPTTFLIHAAVQGAEEPVSESGIRCALLNGLRRAVEWEIGSLSLPPLGTGAGNLDPEGAARVLVEVLRNHLASEDYPQGVTIVVPGPYDQEIFVRELARTEPRS